MLFSKKQPLPPISSAELLREFWFPREFPSCCSAREVFLIDLHLFPGLSNNFPRFSALLLLLYSESTTALYLEVHKIGLCPLRKQIKKRGICNVKIIECVHIIKAIHVHDVTSLSWSVRMQKGRKEGHNMLDQYLYFSFSVLLFKLTKILPITFLLSFDNHIDTILKIDNA